MVSRSPSIAFHTQLSTRKCPTSRHLCDLPHMCCLTCVPPLPFHPSVTLVPLVLLFLTFQMSPHVCWILTECHADWSYTWLPYIADIIHRILCVFAMLSSFSETGVDEDFWGPVKISLKTITQSWVFSSLLKNSP